VLRARAQQNHSRRILLESPRQPVARPPGVLSAKPPALVKEAPPAFNKALSRPMSKVRPDVAAT